MDPPRVESILQSRQILRCDEKHGGIICLMCNTGFPLKRVSLHVRNEHHIPKVIYDPILESFKRKTILTEDWKHLPLPADDKLPIEGLRVKSGYFCTGCGHRSINYEVMKKHLKCAGEVNQVHLQCWNPNRAHKYWIVRNMEIDVPNPPVSQSGSFQFQYFLTI